MDDESLARLERILLATWPACEIEERDGWVAGFNHGFTGRANTVTALRRTDAAGVDERCDWVERWYRSRGQPPAFRLTPLSFDLEDALARRGYRWWRNGASVMTGALGSLTGLPTPETYTAVSAPAADDTWYRLSGHGADVRAILNDMFDGVSPPSLHASMCHGDQPVAIGRGVLHDGHLVIFGMETAPGHRRRGLATAVIGRLARWAAEFGADQLSLQVELGNDGARALYEALGLTVRYDYRYVALAH